MCCHRRRHLNHHGRRRRPLVHPSVRTFEKLTSASVTGDRAMILMRSGFSCTSGMDWRRTIYGSHGECASIIACAKVSSSLDASLRWLSTVDSVVDVTEWQSHCRLGIEEAYCCIRATLPSSVHTASMEQPIISTTLRTRAARRPSVIPQIGNAGSQATRRKLGHLLISKCYLMPTPTTALATTSRASTLATMN